MKSSSKVLLFVTALSILCLAPLVMAQDMQVKKFEHPPHYPEGKMRPDPAYVPAHAVVPTERATPGTGVIDVTPEFEWMDGVLLTWNHGWPEVVTDVALASADATNETYVYMMVDNATVQQNCYNALNAAGVDMNRIIFIEYPMDSVWMRDYGPHYIWHDDTRAIVDSHYYPTRPKDNASPIKIAWEMGLPIYDIPMMYSGGNYQSTSNKHGYITSIVYNDNPGLSETQIANLYKKYQGVETLHIFTAFPYSIDGTGHIDMWMYILSDDNIIIGEYPQLTPTYQAYVITENAVTYFQNLGFTVYRVPNHNSGANGYNGTHFTYTNGFQLNNKILVPVYGGTHAANDRAALNAYQAAMPSSTIVPIDSINIIPYAGALHCIVMQVNAYTDAVPAVKVLSPAGGELWPPDMPRDITWAADDDEEVTSVDLYLSTDGGVTFPVTIATGEPDDGVYEGWECPWSKDDNCVVKVVAHDGSANQAEDMSDNPFAFDWLSTRHYDFSSGANVNKFAYGSFTQWWSELEGTRLPANASTTIDQIQANAYMRIAASDETAGPAGYNRYINPKPAAGKESTLIVEFNLHELTHRVHALEFLWEGFAGDTHHMEMYVWDYVEGNWGDGRRNHGNNAFMDNMTFFSHDRQMKGFIVDDVWRYMSGDGQVTMLIYCDRAATKTFHDYVRLTVIREPYEARPLAK